MPATPIADPLAMTLPREPLPQRSALPVIRRIVRCTPLERDRMIARAVAYAIDAVRSAARSTVGSMMAVGVLLAALGASSGVALRSLAGPALSPPSASPAPAATVEVSATALQSGGLQNGVNDVPEAVDESARPAANTDEAPLAAEPVARGAMTARTTLPVPRGPRAHGAQRSDHRATRGRIHPTSARPLARHTTTSKSKVP